VQPRGCKVPKLVGLSLVKAKRALTKAGCRMGHVTRKAGHRHGRVLRQKTRRGVKKPAGFKVALTVAR
jgi:beta-lactam-binding protein with PASTA domain